MKITFTVAGSRGDLQPYVALGTRLRAEGAEVRIAAPAMFEDLVVGHGLKFSPIPLDPWGAISRVLGGRSTNLLAAGRASRKELSPIMDDLLHTYSKACEGADAVVYSPVGFLGRAIAQDKGISSVGAACQPFLNRTSSFPSAFLPVPGRQVWAPGKARWRVYNRLTYTFSQQLLWSFIRAPANRALSGVDGSSPLPRLSHLKELNESGELILNGWSPRVLPHPPDWGDNLPITGYWTLPDGAGWTPPGDLVEFLECGPAPVVIGFGSIAGEDPQELRDLLVGALRRARRRGVVLTGWSGLSNAEFPEDVYSIPEAPHDWIFSKAEAVIHHGGAGTTGASLRSGNPTIVMPFYADQLFWARRVAHLEAGVATLPRAKMSASRLAEAIEQATNDWKIKVRAQTLGRDLRSENGVEVATKYIYQMLQNR
ncbi:glycosyltransferase [Rubrobacter aplysinae]|uniref:glycosyltransferase n=1 Tax=Rubrobacter aplysinae TaxID=909625 RepID=UPI00064BD5BA